MDLKSRYLNVVNEIKDFNLKAKGQAKLIAVSKKFSTDDILVVHKLGQIDFAENYVNELVTKIDLLKYENIRWHFIGHLQTNKVDKVVGFVDLIHSVDSQKLMLKINQVAEKKNIVQKILLQIKFGDEQTKSGFDLQNLEEISKLSKDLTGIEIQGLMTILPLGISDDQKKECFQNLRFGLLQMQQQFFVKTATELSMGMSDDFKLAISEGSTMIRVGSAIFGARS